MLTKRRDERERMSITFDLDDGDVIADVLELAVLLDGIDVSEALLEADPEDAATPDGATVSFWTEAGGARGLHRVRLRVRTLLGRDLTSQVANGDLYPLMVR